MKIQWKSSTDDTSTIVYTIIEIAEIVEQQKGSTNQPEIFEAERNGKEDDINIFYVNII